LIFCFIDISRILCWIRQSGSSRGLLPITGISPCTDVFRATYGI